MTSEKGTHTITVNGVSAEISAKEGQHGTFYAAKVSRSYTYSDKESDVSTFRRHFLTHLSTARSTSMRLTVLFGF